MHEYPLMKLSDSELTETRLPEKGTATVRVIGAIIGILLLLIIITTVVVLVLKQRKRKADGPPAYKPPPPTKPSMSSDRILHSGINQDAPPELPLVYYETQKTEPITDLDSYHGEEDVDGPRPFDYSAPSGWEMEEDLPPYSDPQHMDRQITAQSNMASSVSRGDSFMSPAVFV